MDRYAAAQVIASALADVDDTAAALIALAALGIIVLVGDDADVEALAEEPGTVMVNTADNTWVITVDEA